MGTEKRERQKANRALGQQQAQQAQTRSRVTRVAIIVGGAVLAIVGLVFIANLIAGDDEQSDDADGAPLDAVEESTEPVATDAPTTTEAPVLSEPENVEIPTVEQNPDEVVPDGCPPIEGTDAQTQEFAEAPPFCLDPAIAYTAVVTTNLGTIEIDLDQELAPTTVNSFVFLARNNYFDDTVCHRIIQEFVVQCTALH
ncbi:MAG: peptidylprolyl isomerase, partial [Actinomycetota bacterium]